MVETVTCPSGLVLDLEHPQLRRLLCHGALGVRELAASCMDRASARAHELCEQDSLFVASWAARHLDSTEALVFASLCETYGQMPSSHLRVTHPVLAYEIDLALTAALSEYREKHKERSGSWIAPDDPVYGFPREDGQ